MHSRPTRRFVSAVAIAVAALAAQIVGTPAAATTIPRGSVQVVVAQYPFDALAEKSFSANCPPGQRVLGAGAFTVGGLHAVITEMQPIHTAGGDSVRVTAAEDQFGVAGNWSFQVFAFCAAVAPSLGLEIVTHTNAPTSSPADQAVTRCPPGKKLIGVGGRIDNGAGQVDLGFLTNSRGQAASGSGAIAKEDADGFAGTYTVTGHSVCARETVPGDFQQLPVDTTGTGTGFSSTNACPSGALTGLAGFTSTPSTHVQRLTPNRTNAPTLATSGAAASVTPSGSWSMTTTLFCAK